MSKTQDQKISETPALTQARTKPKASSKKTKTTLVNTPNEVPVEVESPDSVPDPVQAEALVQVQAEVLDPDPVEIPEHLQGFPTTLSKTEKQSCFICGRFLSSKQALIRHLQAEQKVPIHLEDIELGEQINAFIELLKKHSMAVNETLSCQYCQHKYSNKYYRRQHEISCRFNPENKKKQYQSET